MPTTTSPLTPATHGLRVAASFNPRSDRLSLFVLLRKLLVIMYFRITEVPNTFALSDEQIRVTEGRLLWRKRLLEICRNT
jgi:hypothetical protein